MTKVKICGVTNYEDAKAALGAGADALGFNFYEKSPRCISVSGAQGIARKLPPTAWFVGVFVNHTREEVEKIARSVPLDTLQFHGDESVEFCEGWKEWRVMKVLRLREEMTVDDIEKYLEVVDYVLLDSFHKGKFGGTGKEISDDLLLELQGKNIFERAFLSGGLTPENICEKVKKYRPFGVDVASGVEEKPGKKSNELIKDFIARVRGADKNEIL